MDFKKLNFITQKFFIDSKVLSIKMVDSGLINKTYIVEHLYNGIKSKFILQSLSNIFVSHEIVNMNHKLITDHIKSKINKTFSDFDCKEWKVPSLIRCKSNNLFGFAFESDYWRAMLYIDQALNFDSLEDEIMAYQTGIGLARFHSLCSDFDSSKLENSINNFHDTRYYIDQYIKTIKDYNFNKLDNEVKKKIQELISSLDNHIVLVDFLLISLSHESIDLNVIHGDPKLSNFLFDFQYKHVVSLIDLDTVSSGYLLTDLADCIRSICNVAGGNPKDNDDVCFDVASCKYFLKGYFSITKESKNYSFRFLPEFIYLIIFELTIRFLTDFLQSNRYFKIKYETHNLFRAEVQYRLLSSFLLQMPNLSNELDNIGVPLSSNFVSDIKKIL
tara:strand:- start:8 stop:1171 length:1164 start_codon:yes stop_codon:yes gene_type:complete